MIYLVTGEFDNCEMYEDHFSWTEVFGIVDSLELGKEWIRERKQYYEDECKANIEKRLKEEPDISWNFGLDSYEEHEDEEHYEASFHVILETYEEISCCCTVKKIELNTKLINY